MGRRDRPHPVPPLRLLQVCRRFRRRRTPRPGAQCAGHAGFHRQFPQGPWLAGRPGLGAWLGQLCRHQGLEQGRGLPAHHRRDGRETARGTVMAADMIVAEGRDCSGCTRCCELLSVAELDKEPMVLCAHCQAAEGCRIYRDRPTECRQFYCGYLLDPTLDERWKPSRSKLVVAFGEHPYAVAIHVDVASPHAWREEPFHSQIRQWAMLAGRQGGKVVVWQGAKKIVVPAEPNRAAAAVSSSVSAGRTPPNDPM